MDISEPHRLLERQGLRVIKGINDGNEFYRHISAELYNGDKNHPKSARKEVIRLEKDANWMYFFQMFSTENFQSDKSSKELLLKELKIKGSNFEPPSYREIYASATKIAKPIYIFCKVETEGEPDERNAGTWIWIEILSLQTQNKSSDEPLMFLRFQENRKYLFFKIDVERPGLRKKNKFSHTFCHSHRYQNPFHNKTHTGLTDDIFADEGTGNVKWKEDKDYCESNSLFRSISKELYGTEKYQSNVSKCLEEFMVSEKYKSVSTDFNDVKDKKKPVNNTDNKKTFPGEAEVFAAASILKTVIFVCIDFASDTERWEMYEPLTGTAIGNSYIALHKKGNVYNRLYRREQVCSCIAPPPLARGKIRPTQQELWKIIDGILEKKRCCSPDMRHGRHPHLKHIVRRGRSQCDNFEERCEYVEPIDATTSTVLNVLKMENRILDQIGQGGGSIFHCLSKEIYGTDEHFGLVKDQMPNRCLYLESTEKELIYQAAADFISRPVYIMRYLNKGKRTSCDEVKHKWTCFMPRLECNEAENCRYYVTLYHKEEGVFDRIVPKRGCNCQYRPPFSFMEQTTDGDGFLVNEQESHEPMVEFLLDDIQDEDFQKEKRNISIPHPFFESYHFLQREDMKFRCIDQVKMDSNSFYRCLSKEIFGTEMKFGYLRIKICLELDNNKDMITQYLYNDCDEQKENGTVFSKSVRSEATIEKLKKEQLYKCRLELSRNDSEADDIEILAAATFLQTPIYVLCLNEKNKKTYWREFLQLRTKPKPLVMPKRQSRCRQLGNEDRYNVTILRTSSGHYDRIVPKQDICNCLMDPPSIPSSSELFLHVSQQEHKVLEIARDVEKSLSKVEICLNDWFNANEHMIETCETVAKILEARRKNVNKATIAGSSTGLIGGVLAIAGLAIGPVTMGAGFGLTVAGGVIGGVGGLTATGSKVSEFVLSKMDHTEVTRSNKLFERRLIQIQDEMQTLKEKLETLNLEMKTDISPRRQTVVDSNIIQSLVGLTRAINSFISIPLVVARISLRAATVANAILGPFTVVFDAAFMAHAIWNLIQGSKTNESENLRRLSSQQTAARIQMKTWAYGN